MPNCSAATPGSASQRHCCFSYCSVKYVCGAPLAWAPSPDSCSSETGLELIDGKGRRQSAALVTIKINGRGWSIAFSRKLTAWRLCLSFGEFRVICQIKIYIVGEVRLTWKKCQEKEDTTGQKGPLSAVLFNEEQNKKYQSHAITKSRPLVFCHVSACQKTSEQAPCSPHRWEKFTVSAAATLTAVSSQNKIPELFLDQMTVINGTQQHLVAGVSSGPDFPACSQALNILDIDAFITAIVHYGWFHFLFMCSLDLFEHICSVVLPCVSKQNALPEEASSLSNLLISQSSELENWAQFFLFPRISAAKGG